MMLSLLSPTSTSCSSIPSSSHSSPWSSSIDSIDCEFSLDKDIDMHSIAPFALSPATSSSTSGSSGNSSHPPSPYLLSHGKSSTFPLRVTAMPSSPSFSAFSAPQPLRHPPSSPSTHHICQHHYSHTQIPVNSPPLPSHSLTCPHGHHIIYKPTTSSSNGFKSHPQVTHAITLQSSPAFPASSSPSYTYQPSTLTSPSFTALPPSASAGDAPPRYLQLSPINPSNIRSISQFTVVPIPAPLWREDHSSQQHRGGEQAARSILQPSHPHRPAAYTVSRELSAAAKPDRQSKVREGREEAERPAALQAGNVHRAFTVSKVEMQQGEGSVGSKKPTKRKKGESEVEEDEAEGGKSVKVLKKLKKARPALRISTCVTSLSTTSSSSSTPPSPSTSQPAMFSPTSSHSSSALIFACPSCPRRFSRNSNLTRHKRIHSNERRFHCPHCRKGFMEKHHLTAHARTHTGEKPYKCPQCPRQFTDRSNCSRHIRTHGLSPIDTDEEEEEGKVRGEGEGVREMKVRQVRVKQDVKVERPTEEEKVKKEEEKVQDPSPISSPPANGIPFPPTSSPPIFPPIAEGGRKDSLEPFSLQHLQSPVLTLTGAHSPTGRRASYSSFSLSPSFTSSSPVLHLLSVSHDMLSPPLAARPSPHVPSLPSLIPPRTNGLIGVAQPGVYSISSTLSAMASHTSPSTSSSTTPSSAEPITAEISPSAASAVESGTGEKEAGVEASSGTHTAVPSLVTAANVAETGRGRDEEERQEVNGRSVMDVKSEERPTPKTASDHLHALYSKLIKERQLEQTTSS